MPPQDEFGGLEAATRQFEATKREAAALVAGLTVEQLNWKPAPGRWSIAQCLLHLAQGTDAVLPAIDRAIAKARERGLAPRDPSRYGWFTRMMVRSMEPPPKRPMRTSPLFEPPGTAASAADVERALLAARDRLLERTRAAAAVDLRRAIVVSPVSRLIRVPLGGYLAFLAAHDRRHLWQAGEVKRTSGFGQR
jgi:hypothetical protein